LQDAGQNCKTLNVVFFPHTNTKLNGHPNVVTEWLLVLLPQKNKRPSRKITKNLYTKYIHTVWQRKTGHFGSQNDINSERSDYQQYRKTETFVIKSEFYLHSTGDIACKDIILFRTKKTNETNGNTTTPTHLQERPSWPSLHVLHLSACRGGPRDRPVDRQTNLSTKSYPITCANH
jgi:hypothetical protein